MIPADDIERAQRCDVLVEAERLGAKLRRAASAEYAGPCPACGGTDRFSVNTRKQVFNCRGSGAAGDVIAMVQHAAGLSFGDAIEHLAGRSNAISPRSSNNKISSGIKASPAPLDDGAVRRQRAAAQLITQLRPVVGTPAEAYLAGRKIDTAALADVLSTVDALGWHPSVFFAEPGDPSRGIPPHPLDRKLIGCLIGVMTDAVTGRRTGAISRTYIHEGKKLGKAKTLGQPAGIVRLSPDDAVEGGLHLAEGLETALDAMARGFRPIWSTGSTALMASFPVLPGIECLTIFADHDENGAGERAARSAVDRWATAGLEARYLMTREPGDLNDLSKGGR